jgi:hypothetical protein
LDLASFLLRLLPMKTCGGDSQCAAISTAFGAMSVPVQPNCVRLPTATIVELVALDFGAADYPRVGLLLHRWRTFAR